MDSTARTLQDLYDSEVNFAIAAFWDAGFQVKIGDELHGFAASETVDNFAQAIEWLRVQTLELYPESVSAKAYRR
ncbi:hypothetical protein [Bradyrhizobium sp. 199]|uniref:hypothetical protein n=1 Tax=Bradyrhizobium sp. 199 TaxID=2782664 RepID=UPI001FFAE818|nr:hypothetical protein [Bradyrhizobium sp. 199]MCK1358934.1 hypothetical protein [Bradyrhizobium sp. 199]